MDSDVVMEDAPPPNEQIPSSNAETDNIPIPKSLSEPRDSVQTQTLRENDAALEELEALGLF